MTRAAGWAALAESAARLSQPVGLAVLARFLDPSAFGVAASAAIIISFSSALWSAGLPNAFIQRAADDEDLGLAADVMFWSNLGLAVALYAVAFMAADHVAALFGDARVAAVVRVQGVQIPVMALSATHVAWYQRKLEHRRLLAARISASVVPMGLAVTLAIFGVGYWSLVAGALAGAVSQTWLLWRGSEWRPSFRYDRHTARSLGGFAAWSGGEAVLAWLVVWVDAIVVGSFLGTRELGLYRTAALLVGSVFAVLVSPLQPVLFAALSRLQDDLRRLRRAFRRTVHLVVALALPVGVGLAWVAPFLEELVLGRSWRGIAPVIVTLAVVNALSWSISLNSSAYAASGRPDLSTKTLLASITVYIPLFVVSAKMGLTALLMARLIGAVSSFSLQVAVARRALGFSVQSFVRTVARPVAGTAIMSLVVAPLVLSPAPRSWWRLVGTIVAGAATYMVAMWFLDRRSMLDIWTRVRRVARPS